MSCLRRSKDQIVFTEISHSSIQQLLSDQYHSTEEYCNATTALYNTVLEQHQTVIPTFESMVSQFEQTASIEADHALKLRLYIDRYQSSLFDIQNKVHILEKLVLTVTQRKEQLHTCSSSLFNNDDELSSSATFIRLLNLPILQDHVQRTYRILQTIYTFGEGASYYSNGILTPKPIETHQKKSNVKLVALATLRASIQIVKESLPP
jgi:hypothetical protein